MGYHPWIGRMPWHVSMKPLYHSQPTVKSQLECFKTYHALALLYIHLVAEHDLLAVSILLDCFFLTQVRLTKGKLSGSMGLA
jgi:hypothetical protein